MPSADGIDQGTLADGEAVEVRAREAQTLHIIPGAGATVTVSKIAAGDGSHDSDTQVDVTSETTFSVVWPVYRVSTAGGSCRFCAM